MQFTKGGFKEACIDMGYLVLLITLITTAIFILIAAVTWPIYAGIPTLIGLFLLLFVGMWNGRSRRGN